MQYIKILILLSSIELFSQNLVQNPSFEDSRCSSYISNFDNYVEDWSTPTFGTTDLFSSCNTGRTSNPINYNGNQVPKSGKNYAGFYLFSDDNYREYIQGTLSQKLIKGERYLISFYISLAENSDFAIKDLGILLTEQKLKIQTYNEISEKQLKKHDVSNFSLYKTYNSGYFDNKEDWTNIQMEFIATGYENYFTIGNFEKNSKTKKLQVSKNNRYHISYYYIDLISISHKDSINKIDTTTIESMDISDSNPVIEKIELNKDYIFKNVVFDFNSIELSIDAKSEINSVYQFLKRESDTNIMISGHTDDIGTSNFNQTLSENRANAVAEYFISLGLTKQRITSKGFGKSKPITSNDTETARNQNRRVEFKILKN